MILSRYYMYCRIQSPYYNHWAMTGTRSENFKTWVSISPCAYDAPGTRVMQFSTFLPMLTSVNAGWLLNNLTSKPPTGCTVHEACKFRILMMSNFARIRKIVNDWMYVTCRYANLGVEFWWFGFCRSLRNSESNKWLIKEQENVQPSGEIRLPSYISNSSSESPIPLVIHNPILFWLLNNYFHKNWIVQAIHRGMG